MADIVITKVRGAAGSLRACVGGVNASSSGNDT